MAIGAPEWRCGRNAQCGECEPGKAREREHGRLARDGVIGVRRQPRLQPRAGAR
jgi:hypothetical protein